MNALEADALAGAGISPAIDRLRLSIELAPSFGGGVRLSPEFAQSLIALMERCRETWESQSRILAAAIEITWTDAEQVQHFVPVDAARDHLARFYREWPGGFEEIESAFSTLSAALKEKQS